MTNKIEKGFTLMEALIIAITATALAVVTVKVVAPDKPEYKPSNAK